MKNGLECKMVPTIYTLHTHILEFSSCIVHNINCRFLPVCCLSSQWVCFFFRKSFQTASTQYISITTIMCNSFCFELFCAIRNPYRFPMNFTVSTSLCNCWSAFLSTVTNENQTIRLFIDMIDH